MREAYAISIYIFPTMLHLLVSAFVALFGGGQQPASPAAAPPSTDIYVATLSISGGAIRVGRPVNISQSPGYDNQPSFTPDGTGVLFTSDRASKQGSSQMDIFRHDLASGAVSRVTSTDESEYSPTVTPDGSHISVIRVEKDGTQRLWQFQLDGTNPSVVLEHVKPVGYHAWLDASRLALFVLGPPATLQLADARTGGAEVIAKNIGRSIQKIPGGGASFVEQQGQGADRKLMVNELVLDGAKASVRPLIGAVAGAREADLAWTPDGTLLIAHGGSLYAWKKGEAEWRAVADLGALGLKNVSRLAVSPGGDRIALVAAQ